MPKKETGPFVRAFGDAVSGAVTAERLLRHVVTEAVEDAMATAGSLGIADVGSLRRHVADIVDRHAVVTTSGGPSGPSPQKCQGVKLNGRPCGQKSYYGGYCVYHQDQLAAMAAKKRKLEAIATTTAHNSRSAFDFLPKSRDPVI